MKIVLPAEPVSMNVRLKQSLKVTFTKLILKNVRIAELVRMFALLRRFTRNNDLSVKKSRVDPPGQPYFFFTGISTGESFPRQKRRR